MQVCWISAICSSELLAGRFICLKIKFIVSWSAFFYAPSIQKWLLASKKKSCEICKYPFLMKWKQDSCCVWVYALIKEEETTCKQLWILVIPVLIGIFCAIWTLMILIGFAFERIEKWNRYDWTSFTYFWIAMLICIVLITIITLDNWKIHANWWEICSLKLSKFRFSLFEQDSSH